MYDSASPFDPTPERDNVLQSMRGDSAVRVRFAADEQRSHVADLYERGSLRARFPRGNGCECVLLNTGGGITGGDRLAIDLDVDAGAMATVTSQAAEKIYRSDGAFAQVRIAARLASRARLDWLPQETILYDGARVQRSIDVEMTCDAKLTMLETLVVGRVAHGEDVHDAVWQDRWRIRRAERLVFAEAVRLGGDAAALLQRPALGGGARAVATLVHIAQDAEHRLDALRHAIDGVPFPCAASAWNGMLVARFSAPMPHALRAIVKAAAQVVTGGAMPRAWDC